METLSTFTVTDLLRINDTLWYWYSLLVMLLPYNLIWIHKLLHPIDYTILSDPKRPFKKHKVDIFLSYASVFTVFYYIMDIIFKCLTGDIYTLCGCSFVGHHLISIYFLPKVFRVRYWPWFWLGPAAIHAFLLAFPHELWLNYVYLASILLFQLGLYQKPWTHLKEYNQLKAGVFSIEIACFFLWLFICKNTLV